MKKIAILLALVSASAFAGIHCNQSQTCYDDLTYQGPAIGLDLDHNKPTDSAEFLSAATSDYRDAVVYADEIDKPKVSVEFHCNGSTNIKQKTDPTETIITLVCNKNDHSGSGLHIGN